MEKTAIFPDLSGFEATRDTLHAYSKVVGLVPRVHARPHPQWWHISLKVQPKGLFTSRMSLPQGGEFWLVMDLFEHEVRLETTEGFVMSFSMTEGDTASEFGDQVLSALAHLGLEGAYDRQKFASDSPRPYDAEMAREYLNVLLEIDRIFKLHRSTLEGKSSPVQLWTHGFDLSFEWFGSRIVEQEEGGEVKQYPAQLSLGFSPGEPYHPAPYFYSNPWPFEKETLLAQPLPSGARWFTDGWQGSLLPYSTQVGKEDAEDRLLEYARTVFSISQPSLMASS
jgi:hypothetical protein